MKHRGVAGERGGGAGLGRDEAVLPIVQVFSDPRRRPTTGELRGVRDISVADAAVVVFAGCNLSHVRRGGTVGRGPLGAVRGGVVGADPGGGEPIDAVVDRVCDRAGGVLDAVQPAPVVVAIERPQVVRAR